MNYDIHIKENKSFFAPFFRFRRFLPLFLSLLILPDNGMVTAPKSIMFWAADMVHSLARSIYGMHLCDNESSKMLLARRHCFHYLHP